MTEKLSQVGSHTIVYRSEDVEDTLAFGRKLGSLLQPGAIVALVGGLGAGKTWLAKGIAFGLGVPEDEYVNSPAFDLVHEYTGRVQVYHMDFYRLDTLSLEDRLWLLEYFDSRGVCIIEWADKFIDSLVSTYLKIELQWGDQDDSRVFRITSLGQEYLELLERLKQP